MAVAAEPRQAVHSTYPSQSLGIALTRLVAIPATPLASNQNIRPSKELSASTLQASAQKQLRQLVEQIERLEEEKAARQRHPRQVSQPSAVGFDVKVLRQIVRLRKKSQEERQEEETVLEVYMHALGMLDNNASKRSVCRRDDGGEAASKPGHRRTENKTPASRGWRFCWVSCDA
ncbi:MAG: DUF2312 domain-containing protein, partial [Hyphomicrobium sp.]|nr:DUF2312 domain-containing protein [Hyphomicrobium sp.]